MKKVSKKEKKPTENDNKLEEQQQQNSFSAKLNNHLIKETPELSPIELMKYRIEEMNRKLLENRNQKRNYKKS